MYCENHLDISEQLIGYEMLMKKYRSKGRMPVIAVDNIRSQSVNVQNCLQNRLGKECNSFCIIELAIYVISFEIVLVVYEIIRDSAFSHSEKAAV